MMNPLMERSNSTENIFRNSSTASFRRSSLSPVGGSDSRPHVTTVYTPCHSRYILSLQQSAVKVRVNDPYARNVVEEPLMGTLSSGCPSLDTSDESVRSPLRCPPTIATPSKAMTRVYINGRPVPAFATGELAVAFPSSPLA